MVLGTIDFSEDIEELRQVDGAWPAIYVGPKPMLPDTGMFWTDIDSMDSYVYDGVQWIQILLSEV